MSSLNFVTEFHRILFGPPEVEIWKTQSRNGHACCSMGACCGEIKLRWRKNRTHRRRLRAAEAETYILNAIALTLKMMVRALEYPSSWPHLSLPKSEIPFRSTSCAAAASLPRSSSTIFVDTVFLVQPQHSIVSNGDTAAFHRCVDFYSVSVLDFYLRQDTLFCFTS